MSHNPLSREVTIESLLEDELLFEEVLKRAYDTQVVFNDFVQKLSSELARLLGRNDPSLDHAVRSTILTHPFREKFFRKLAKVAQG